MLCENWSFFGSFCHQIPNPWVCLCFFSFRETTLFEILIKATCTYINQLTQDWFYFEIFASEICTIWHTRKIITLKYLYGNQLTVAMPFWVNASLFFIFYGRKIERTSQKIHYQTLTFQITQLKSIQVL